MTGTVTPIVTGLNAAHGLLFMPAAPGVPDVAALYQTLSRDLAQAFANLGVFTGQAGAFGPAGTTPDASTPSAASIIGLLSGNASSALAGLLPVAKG